MDRYNSPRMPRGRGGAQGSQRQAFGGPARQTATVRSGGSLLGAPPRRGGSDNLRPRGQFESDQRKSADSWGSAHLSKEEGILGSKPRSYDSYEDSYSATQTSTSESWSKPDSNTNPISSEVNYLMETLGLSKADMQKLSELPESELSVGNLAKAISSLKEEKPHEPQPNTSSLASSKRNDSEHIPSLLEPRFSTDRGDRDRMPPSHESRFRNDRDNSERMPPSQSRIHNERSDSDRTIPPLESRFRNIAKESPSKNDGLLGAGPSKRDRSETSDRHDGNDRYPRSLRGGASGDAKSYGNDGLLGAGPARKGRPELSDTNRMRLGESRLLSMGSSSKSLNPKPAGTLPNRKSSDNLTDRPKGRFRQFKDGADDYYDDYGDSFDRRPSRFPNSQQSSSRYLDDDNIRGRQGFPPRDPRDEDDFPARGMSSRGKGLLRGPPGRPPPLMGQKLANESRGSGGILSQAASLLNPLAVADPSVIEAQIQAMKVLQAEAIKLKHLESGGREMRRREMSPPPRFRGGGGGGGPKRQNMNSRGRLLAEEMRQARGRVLYIRYKSSRVTEGDLRGLAGAFGRISGLLIVKSKVANQLHQCFMELEQWDCAAAMLEHYMERPPIIKGCEILIDRSNYTDLKLREKEFMGKRRRIDMSPIRDGPMKRSRLSPRSGEKPRINVSISADKRIVRTDDRKAAGEKDDRKSKEKSVTPSGSRGGKSGRGGRQSRARSTTEEQDPKDVDGEGGEKNTPKDLRNVLEEKQSAAVGTDGTKDEEKIGDKTEEKEDISDPLDDIADELAQHEDFVLMDAVGSDTAADSNTTPAKMKPGDGDAESVDLEAADLDLENLDADLSQDDFFASDRAADGDKTAADEEANKTEDDVAATDANDEEQQAEDKEAAVVANGDCEMPFVNVKRLHNNEQTPGDNEFAGDGRKPEEDLDYEADDAGDVTLYHDAAADAAAPSQEEVDQLRLTIKNALEDLEQASSHLDAIVKVTRAKQTLQHATKLRESLTSIRETLEEGCSPDADKADETL